MEIIKCNNLKTKPNFDSLGFGKFFTDYMLAMEYCDGAWQAPVIKPYGDFNLSPSTSCLHYGQGIFEGLKAYKSNTGKITMFRPEENIKRMNNSARRLCMPELDVNLVVGAIKELVLLENDWIPVENNRSLYIRPTMIAVDPVLGVHASKKYIFFVILSPVGSYYANGLAPTKIFVEDTYVRATIGGTGEAKCMGNYAASLLAGERANKNGFDQVLWLDGRENKYAEEVGSMNIFFVIDGIVITPALNGSILPGITRKSIIEVLKQAGHKVEERKISVEEIYLAHKNGTLTEAFGSGTAAVVSPVGMLSFKGDEIIINNNKMGNVTNYAYNTLTGIQTGKIADSFNWVQTIN